MEITFPAKENFDCLDKVVIALKNWINELKVSINLIFTKQLR